MSTRTSSIVPGVSFEIIDSYGIHAQHTVITVGDKVGVTPEYGREYKEWDDAEVTRITKTTVVVRTLSGSKDITFNLSTLCERGEGRMFAAQLVPIDRANCHNEQIRAGKKRSEMMTEFAKLCDKVNRNASNEQVAKAIAALRALDIK